MATPAAPVQMIKASGRNKHRVKRDDSGTLVANISKAMRKVGIRREAVFVTKASSAKKVYAYSVLPSDTSKIVRESADGTRTIGRFSKGQFRTVKTKNA